MPTKLYETTSDYDANMIASLMRDCGYASKMDYNEGGSGAALYDAVDAIRDVFGFKSSAKHLVRGALTNGWIDKMKKEISEGRPVIYSGFNSKWEGHTFVLFGYTKDNRFRVNWGWSNTSTAGEYLLSALGDKPDIFSLAQNAIIGIEPNYPECGQDYVLYNVVASKLPVIPICFSGTVTTSAEFGPNNYSDEHIRSSQFGYIYSGEEVRLKAPFYIDKGANVHIAIRDAHCGGRNNMPAKISDEVEEHENDAIVAANEFYVSPNPATDYIEIHSSATLKNISIINSNGQCVMQSMNTYIPTYSLPSGLYIVRALTEDNYMLQTKFLKQ